MMAEESALTKQQKYQPGYYKAKGRYTFFCLSVTSARGWGVGKVDFGTRPLVKCDV